MLDDTLVYFGDAVKALGSGKVGGYLVRFGTPETADCQGEFFAPACNFGRAMKSGVDIYYHHAMPRRGDPFSATLGKRTIGDASLSQRPDGIWAEGQLDVADDAVKSLYADVEKGKVGWSSGSADRFVVREPVKGKVALTNWPIIDATLSYIPVDPRNKAYALKALIEDIEGGAVAAPSLVERSDEVVAAATELLGLYAKAQDQRTAEGRHLSPDKRAAIKALSDRFADLADAARPRLDPAKVRAARAALAKAGL